MPIPLPQLDQRQLEAVAHHGGPLLVIAGAGSGKTTVLVKRMAQLIRNQYAQPKEILAVTFTDNSAAELRRRVQQELANLDCSDLKASTFHAYCFGLLQKEGRGFDVLSKEDLWVFLRRNIAELKLERFIKAANPGQFLHDLLNFYDRCHDELVSAADYQQYVDRVKKGELPLPRIGKSKDFDELPREEVLARCQEIARVYATVEKMLAAKNLGSYGDMITQAVALLRNHPEIRQREQAGAKFILVDEFQDSNVAQIELAALLAGAGQNVFAVGDPDQAIYRFRGASSGAFDEFRRKFPGTRTVRLERNHRSTTSILRCAFAAISKNPDVASDKGALTRRSAMISAREEDAVKNKKRGSAEPVMIALAQDAATEAADIAETVRAARAAPVHCSEEPQRWRDFAVLYRLHAHREKLAEEFSARHIPFAVFGVNVLETTPVRDLLAAMRSLQSPEDAVSLLRLAALPQFAIAPGSLQKILLIAGGETDLPLALSQVNGGEKLLATLEHCRKLLGKRNVSASSAIQIASQCFAFDPMAPSVLAFKDFVEVWQNKPIAESGSLREFLEYLDFYVEAGGKIRLPDPPRELDAVGFLTVHAAKGLEFRHVHVIRLNSGSFPTYYREPLFAFPDELRHSPAAAREDDKQLHAEEELRLFYVAMTRARDSLTLSAKPGTGKDGTPSGFLRALMKEKTLATVLRSRTAQPYRIELAASAAHAAPSAVSGWLQLPPQRLLADIPLSATAIEMYKRCPLQFKIAQDWKLPGEVAGAMQFGAAMHSVLKFYFDELRAGRVCDGDEVEQEFKKYFSAMLVEDSLQRSLYERQGIAQLRAFVASRQSAAAVPERVLQTECAFKVEIYGVKVTGRVDRIDAMDVGFQAVAITDYKTGRPRTQKDADESLQLTLYALGAERAWRVNARRLIFHNLEDNSLVETFRTATDLRLAEDDLRAVAQAIAAEQFDPKPGFHCSWCAYRSLCPATEQKLYTIENAASAGVYS